MMDLSGQKPCVFYGMAEGAGFRYTNDSVILQFGHGNTPGNNGDLESIVQQIRSMLTQLH